MARTYKALLKGNCIEWSSDAPLELTPERAVAVLITILDEPALTTANLQQGQRMAAVLEQLAHAQAIGQ